MGLSKSTRMIILLSIDSAFFMLELIIGYSVHSLALVADSFHMLNDVISLFVGLWAVRVAQSGMVSARYTYGWQRAETLGALFNGVFLVALCVSIFLEAIQRFVEPQVISKPQLVLIVGFCGLASNIVGLFLFHEHGPIQLEVGDGLVIAEEGRYRDYVDADADTTINSDNAENVINSLSQNRLADWPTTGGYGSSKAGQKSENRGPKLIESVENDENGPLLQQQRNESSGDPGLTIGRRSLASPSHRHRGSSSRPRGFSSVDNISVHPASLRQEIIAASKMTDISSQNESEDCAVDDSSNDMESTEATDSQRGSRKSRPHHYKGHDSWQTNTHTKKKKESKQSSNGDLNMRGVFLHVMGDALGNFGVISTAIFIWRTDYWWRYYTDPLVSLVITAVILCSAIPLCLAASRILLQATPEHINVDEIYKDILDIDGVVGCHHLHVWQLSDSKLIASLHVQVRFDGAERYMDLAHAVRRCLHEYGIHSSTIQQEYCLDSNHDHSDGNGSSTHDGVSRSDSHRSLPDACLLNCGSECGKSGICCAPAANNGSLEEYHD